jgi:hypothetical protein
VTKKSILFDPVNPVILSEFLSFFVRFERSKSGFFAATRKYPGFCGSAAFFPLSMRHGCRRRGSPGLLTWHGPHSRAAPSTQNSSACMLTMGMGQPKLNSIYQTRRTLPCLFRMTNPASTAAFPAASRPLPYPLLFHAAERTGFRRLARPLSITILPGNSQRHTNDDLLRLAKSPATHCWARLIIVFIILQGFMQRYGHMRPLFSLT